MTRPPRYSLADFDDHGVLRVSPLLWILVVYAGRHLLTPLLGGTLDGWETALMFENAAAAAFEKPSLHFLSSSPTLLVVLAHFKRLPTASGLVRCIWHHGRWLLMIAVAMDLLLLSLATLSAGTANGIEVAMLCIDCYFLAYLFRSRRIIDTFADFPSPLTATSHSRPRL